MADTTDINLAALARTNGRQFLSAFLEGLAEQADGETLSTSDVYEIEELDSTAIVDGIHLELVHSEGGHEGDGEHVERVMAIHQLGNGILGYIRVTGFYQSYNGTEYNDDWTLVEPREVVVTQYFDIE